MNDMESDHHSYSYSVSGVPDNYNVGPNYHYQKDGVIKGRVFPLAGFARVSAGVTLPSQYTLDGRGNNI